MRILFPASKCCDTILFLMKCFMITIFKKTHYFQFPPSYYCFKIFYLL